MAAGCEPRLPGSTGRPFSAAERGVSRAPTSPAGLPVMHSSVHELIDRKIGRLVWIVGGQIPVELDAQAWLVARMQPALGEGVRVRERLVGQLDMRHVLLNAEVVNGEAE